MPEQIPNFKHLVMVTGANNNKYYKLYYDGGDAFRVEYGRIGSTTQRCSYPVSQYWKKYHEKVNKGYVDQTDIFTVPTAAVAFATISNSTVDGLVSRLQGFASRSVQQNYTVEAAAVTQAQVDAAQQILDDLVATVQVAPASEAVNERLLKLYMTIPRRMGNTRDHLLPNGSLNDQSLLQRAERMLADEQATLDVMRGQVKTNTVQQANTNDQTTVLSALGLEIFPVNDQKTIQLIKDKLQNLAPQFKAAYQVVNQRTQGKFDTWIGQCGVQGKSLAQELFWHGSRNENWWSIIDTGLVLRPANAVISGKMFGYGIYLADKAQKSYGYTSGRGSYWARGGSATAIMALYDVHVGNQLHIRNHQHWCYDLTEQKLRARGPYDSLFAEGGADLRNNEYIVYNEAQLTIRYLVELSA